MSLSLLAEAIGTYAVGLPVRPGEEMSAAERAAFEELGVDVDDGGQSDHDPMQAGVIALARMIETALTVSEAAKRLGDVTESRIHQRIKAGEIYSFRIDSRRHIPAFQFRDWQTCPQHHRGQSGPARKSPSGGRRTLVLHAQSRPCRQRLRTADFAAAMAPGRP